MSRCRQASWATLSVVFALSLLSLPALARHPSRCDEDGTCYTALNSFWHQHFNPGTEPVRYLAITHGRYHMSLRARPAPNREANVAHFGDEMDYEEEEAWVREKFRKACAKNGVKVDDTKMNKKYELSLPKDSYMVRDDS